MKLENLETEFLGRNIFFYKNIDSTQSEIRRMIEKNNIKYSGSAEVVDDMVLVTAVKNE